MPNYDVQIIDKHQHENNKHMLSYTNYFDKSGRKKRHKLAETVNNAQTREAARKLECLLNIIVNNAYKKQCKYIQHTVNKLTIAAVSNRQLR